MKSIIYTRQGSMCMCVYNKLQRSILLSLSNLSKFIDVTILDDHLAINVCLPGPK